MDPRMNFKQLVDENLGEFNKGFYCGLSQEAMEHIDALARGTFFKLNAGESRALFEKLSASKRESEEHGL
jgi:hypothetical protein